MHFNLLSLFPDYFDSPLAAGLMAKARDKGLVSFSFVDPRDFTQDNYRSVDDRPYGGGPGMVMLLEPLAKAMRSLDRPGRILFMSPRGRPLDQAYARDLAQEERVTIICGRYEGVDGRLGELFPIEEVSVGDFVLNGGETGALCVIESISRLVPGFMGHEGSAEEESFSSGALEYPHYTRPEVFEGLPVPEVLTSGDHGRIKGWRRREALRATLARRPDLLETARLSQEDLAMLKDLQQEEGRRLLGRNLFLALVHYPVVNKAGLPLTSSLTNLDIHDIGRVSRTGGCGGYYVCTPLTDQRRLAEKLLHHWTKGAGARSNPDRAEALDQIRVVETLDAAKADVAERTGRQPKVIATSARMEGSVSCSEMRQWLEREPVLLVLGTASGLAREVLDKVDGLLRPIRFLSSYNHLSVRAAAAIFVDRIVRDVY